MGNDDRIVKAILAVGVLNALVADGAKLGKTTRAETVQEVAALVTELEAMIFPGEPPVD